jgi:hypothetical protein
VLLLVSLTREHPIHLVFEFGSKMD